jgi:hypothetical protein
MLSPLIGIIASSGVAASTSSYESIATTTVGSGGTSTISFTSIPATYTHLQIRGVAKGSVSYGGGGDSILMQLNSDTGFNYAQHFLKGNGSAASAGAGTSVSSINVGFITNNNTSVANMFGAVVIDLLDYANTSKYKTVRSLSGADTNGTLSNNDEIDFRSGLWQSTSAVNAITFSIPSANFAQYSQLALYGIKGA